MEELYENLYGPNITLIANDFLNQYLADTKPEYIKVFLFYLWKGIKENYSISDTSNEIDLPETVVEMALKYWIKKKIFKKDCLIKGKKEINDINDTNNNLVNFEERKNKILQKNRKAYTEIEKDLLFVAEKLLQKTITERQMAVIEECYNVYNFDEELIQYLIEYCSNIKKTDARYMRAVASSWYESNVKTIDEAKSLIDSFDKGKSKTNKTFTNKREMDRNVDYSKFFTDSISNGKFK